MEILPIFSSFLIQQKLNIDHEKISQWCLNHSDVKEKIILSFDEPELQDLYATVNDVLSKLHNFLEFKKNTKQQLFEGWVNYNTIERTSVPHTHPRADFVCIYYPRVCGNVGYLELTNPNRAIEYIFPQTSDDSVIQDYNIFNSQLWQVEPQTDLLVVIPAWLQHYVRESEPGSTRLSIALNSRIIKSQ